MQISSSPLARWQLTPREAIELQRVHAPRVRRRGLRRNPRLVAGADVAYDSSRNQTVAAVVCFRYQDLSPVTSVCIHADTTFPYVPGLLSFREAPALVKAFSQLDCRPDVILFDGQGLAHPRRFGLACHMGLLLDIPSVGCAKSRLIGEYDMPGPRRGDWSPLTLSRAGSRRETLGSVLRTRDRVKPLFVSVGHLISLAWARRVVLGCLTRYRLPEPTRQADQLAEKGKRGV